MIEPENVFKRLEIIQSSEILKEAVDKLDAELPENQVADYLTSLKITYKSCPLTWKYSCYLFYLLHQVINKSPLDSHQTNLIAETILKCELHSLEVYIKRHKNRTTYDTTNQSDEEYQKLVDCLRMFDKFFALKFIASNSLFHDVQIDYLVGILSVIALNKDEQHVADMENLLINFKSQIGTELFFQFLMMVRGFQGLSKNFQIQAQNRLLQLIRSENGFYMLCKAILRKQDEKQSWQKYAIINSIAGMAMKSNRKSHVEKVISTLTKCLKSNENEVNSACVYVLKELNGTDKTLKETILRPLDDLIAPKVVLCGSILMEFAEIKEFIDILHTLFSPLTIVTLSSKILHDHFIALFNLYSIMPNGIEKEKLASVVLFVLNNFDRQDLQVAVRHLRLKDNPNVKKIHPRVIFKNNSLQIGMESQGLTDDTESFVELLKNSKNNRLVYEIFLCFIGLLADAQNSNDAVLTGYDLDEDELPDVLHKKFYKQLAIIEPLQEMIQCTSLHSQLNDNPKEILEAIKNILATASNSNDQIVIIFYSIYKELLNKLKDDDERTRLHTEILNFKSKIKSQELKDQIDAIFDTNDEVPLIDRSQFSYNDAMKLLKSKEIYCKVYGSDQFIKLLKKRDKQVIANRHTILAVALQNLREVESYAYLNVIKLLVALSYVLDTEVMDALMVEYQNQELVIDERLKIGEVIVKVSEDLGELLDKFKHELINCFLRGSRDLNNEFRTSSLVNLGTICKLLRFEVSKFFHEMFQQLEIVIRCDEYLPSKRAAAMVLSQLLCGMKNLMDLNDFLVPIYRFLKEIMANGDEDEQTKLHAQIGLEHLNEKTKEFLNPKLDVQKKIKIRLGDENPNKLNEIKYK